MKRRRKMRNEQVDQFRKEGSLITSNTSGIPIHMLAEGRTDDFQKNFCGTHFFNPARYMKLLEIIPHEGTDPGVIDFFMHYGDVYLGKQTVLCKDTPAFIANRIGSDFLPSLRSFPTGFFVTLGSPITPIKSSVI